jgi:hypothetical protein
MAFTNLLSIQLAITMAVLDLNNWEGKGQGKGGAMKKIIKLYV